MSEPMVTNWACARCGKPTCKGDLCERCEHAEKTIEERDGESIMRKLLTIEDVPEDVCPRREAISGAIILWVLAFSLLWFIVLLVFVR